MFRMFDCDTWGDPWIAELEPEGKLLFIYLFTNARTNPAGVYTIALRQASLDTGLPLSTIRTQLAALAERVAWWPEQGVIWVRNFYREQNAGGSDKLRISAQKHLAKVPADVRAEVLMVYPELATPEDTPSPAPNRVSPPLDTLSIPHPYPLDRASLVKERIEREEEREVNDAAGAARPHDSETPDQASGHVGKPPDPAGFAAAWDAYDKRQDRKAAVEQWRRLKPDVALQAVILAAIAAQRKSEKWREGYQKSFFRWLRDRNWEDEVTPGVEPRAGPALTLAYRAEDVDWDHEKQELERRRATPP